MEKSLAAGQLVGNDTFMNRASRIAVIGDYQPGNPTHESVALAIAHVVPEGSSSVQWIGTEEAAQAAERELSDYSGFWIAPGSPYRSMRGALSVIRHAREHDVPLLGTCGGFQHVILEFARNVLGFTDAAHAEYDPYASNLFITALTCSLVGQTMTVALQPGTRAATIYPAPTSAERYYCNFGLNPQHLGALLDAGLVVSGVDQDGEARIVEIPGLKYFLATLFVPQTSSTPEVPHPVVTAFVEAASS